jgi:hypothetical protein
MRKYGMSRAWRYHRPLTASNARKRLTPLHPATPTLIPHGQDPVATLPIRPSQLHPTFFTFLSELALTVTFLQHHRRRAREDTVDALEHRP